MSMGLADTPEIAARALEMTGQDIDQAVNLILSGVDLTGGAPAEVRARDRSPPSSQALCVQRGPAPRLRAAAPAPSSPHATRPCPQGLADGFDDMSMINDQANETTAVRAAGSIDMSMDGHLAAFAQGIDGDRLPCHPGPLHEGGAVRCVAAAYSVRPVSTQRANPRWWPRLRPRPPPPSRKHSLRS